MTYTELVVAISDYLENSITTTDMNTCITQAETRIYNAVKIPALCKTAALTATPASPFMNAPSDFLAQDTFAIIDATTGAYTFLLNKDVSFMREAYPIPEATGTPKYYAVYGAQTLTPTSLQFILGPTPATAIAVQLQYFYYPESITTVAGGETWLSINYSPALFYGSLVEAYTFMKGEADLLALYNTKFAEAIVQLKALCEGKQVSDEYRGRQ